MSAAVSIAFLGEAPRLVLAEPIEPIAPERYYDLSGPVSAPAEWGHVAPQRYLPTRVRSFPACVGDVPCGATAFDDTSACPNPKCIAAIETKAKENERVALRRSPTLPRDPELLMITLMDERAREARAVGDAREVAEERRALVEWLIQGTNTAFRPGRSQADPKLAPPPRVVRAFTPDERDAALQLVARRPIRSFIDRHEFMATFWCELTNPTKRVAARETTLPFARIVEKAVQRAYDHVRPENQNA